MAMYEQWSKLVAAENPRRPMLPPNVYINCDTGIFAGRTIRGEVNEIQKANVGRRCVLFRHASSTTRPGLLPLFEIEHCMTSL
jgi:hypothetical protein